MSDSAFTLSEVQKLFRNADYKACLPILEKIIEEHDADTPRQLIGSMLLTCYQKMAFWDKALAMGSSLCSSENCWDSIKQNYAWVIYFAHFKNRSPSNLEEAVALIDLLHTLTSKQKNQLPLTLAVFSLISKCTLLTPTVAMQLLEKLDYAKLEDKEANPDKAEKWTSHKEQYICHYSKALFMAEQYPLCIDFCQSVLNEKKAISKDNQFWVLRRLALSYFRTNNPEPAYHIYLQLIHLKPDWYLLFELAQIAYALSKTDEALRYSAQAALAKSELEMKLHLWEFLYRLLISQKYFPEAVKCLSLACALRVQKGWSIDANLLKELGKFNLPPSQLPEPNALFLELIDSFHDLAFDAQTLQTGSVANILPHGKAGFIKVNSASYYFRVTDCQFPISELNPGLKVSFYMKKSFDPKKQLETNIAVNIRKVC